MFGSNFVDQPPCSEAVLVTCPVEEVQSLLSGGLRAATFRADSHNQPISYARRKPVHRQHHKDTNIETL